MTKIYIDAGHGGSDPGANGNGLLEKNVTLAIAKKIEAFLKENYENVETLMSRSGDSYPSLDDRTNQANKWGADCFVSVHINASTSAAAKGYQTYIYNKNPDAKTVAFQNVMHTNIIANLSDYRVQDNGKKQENFHVLRESNMTAILTENLFISNSADAALLKKDDFLDSIALGHVIGLEKFFGLKRKVTSPTPPPAPSGKLFQVVAGTFSDRTNADQRVADLKKAGYDSYVDEK